MQNCKKNLERREAISMFDTIEELVTEAVADGGYDTEFTEALEAELDRLKHIQREPVGSIKFIIDGTSDERVNITLQNTETGQAIGIYDERVSEEDNGVYETQFGVPPDALIRNLWKMSVKEL